VTKRWSSLSVTGMDRGFYTTQLRLIMTGFLWFFFWFWSGYLTISFCRRPVWSLVHPKKAKKLDQTRPQSTNPNNEDHQQLTMRGTRTAQSQWGLRVRFSSFFSFSLFFTNQVQQQQPKTLLLLLTATTIHNWTTPHPPLAIHPM
jgi:hypothetical protein